ncbi:smalltalk protein [bacterium]|nr:smalltalk protein [bacterium]
MEDSKKILWRTIINVVVAALSAIATALGVTSCMGLGPI